MLPLLAPNLQACTRKSSRTFGRLRHSFRLFRGLPIVGPHPGEGSMSEARVRHHAYYVTGRHRTLIGVMVSPLPAPFSRPEGLKLARR